MPAACRRNVRVSMQPAGKSGEGGCYRIPCARAGGDQSMLWSVGNMPTLNSIAIWAD